MMNNSVSSAAYVIDPSLMPSITFITDTDLPVNQRCSILLPSILSRDSALLNFIAEYNVEETAELYEDNIYPTLEEQADNEFNSNTNILDLTNLDNQQNVLVLSNCPIYNQKFHFDENSINLSSHLLSPTAYFTEEECMELEVGTNETFFIKKENGKYDQHFSPLTPPMSPKDIVDKARFYVEKKKNRGNKRGRPAKKSNEDIDKQIEDLQKVQNKKKTRVAKNNKASRVYRRKLSEKRETIDNKLADELRKFDELTRHHKFLEAEITRLRNMLGKNTV